MPTLNVDVIVLRILNITIPEPPAPPFTVASPELAPPPPPPLLVVPLFPLLPPLTPVGVPAFPPPPLPPCALLIFQTSSMAYKTHISVKSNPS
jgi:hypothetical protein